MIECALGDCVPTSECVCSCGSVSDCVCVCVCMCVYVCGVCVPVGQ